MPKQPVEFLTVERAAQDPDLDLGVRGINYAIVRGELPARKLDPDKPTSPYLIDPEDWAAFKQARLAAAPANPKSLKTKKRAQA